MDSEILAHQSKNDKSEELQILDNNKTIFLTTTNKEKLVFFKPNNNVNKMYCVLRPEDLQLRLPSPVKVTKPGRPKRVHNTDEHIDISENNTEEVPIKVFRTRSGRITKPPRYINQNLVNNIEHQLETTSPIQLNEKQNVCDLEAASKFVDNKLTITKSQNVIEKRNISSQYRCETCKKAYLGRAKMLKHLQLNSGHIAPKFFKNEKNKDLWTDLLNKTKTVPKNKQVRFIYNEFVSFMLKARDILPKLLIPESATKSDCITVDQMFSNALGISEGCYSFITKNVDDIILNLETENKGSQDEFQKKSNSNLSENADCSNDNLNIASSQSIRNDTNGYITPENSVTENNPKEFVSEITNSDAENSAQIQNNDQNSLLNLLDTGPVTFDNSNSEEVINVDQLIHERLKSLTGGEIETSSASQNLHLDLSLDMFPFHTNNL